MARRRRRHQRAITAAGPIPRRRQTGQTVPCLHGGTNSCRKCWPPAAAPITNGEFRSESDRIANWSQARCAQSPTRKRGQRNTLAHTSESRRLWKRYIRKRKRYVDGHGTAAGEDQFDRVLLLGEMKSVLMQMREALVTGAVV